MERQDAARVVSVLSAAFPAYPMNDDSTQLYVEAISEKVRDATVGFVVVTDWVQGRTLFPAIADLLAECAAEEQRRSRRAAAITRGAREPGAVCPGCQGLGVEYHAVDDDVKKRHASYDDLAFVLPCRICDPIRHEDWSEGHIAIEHDVHACEWPLCKKRAERGKRRRYGEPRAQSEPARVSADPGF